MKLPDKVYLNKFMICPGMLHPAQFPPDNPEEEYIRKGALLEWARKSKLNTEHTNGIGWDDCLDELINHIESL